MDRRAVRLVSAHTHMHQDCIVHDFDPVATPSHWWARRRSCACGGLSHHVLRSAFCSVFCSGACTGNISAVSIGPDLGKQLPSGELGMAL
jgi:hypothetical protein